MNSYYKLGEDRNVTVEEIVSRWKDIQVDLLEFQQKVGKPIVFLEIGWCSLANAAGFTTTLLEVMLIKLPLLKTMVIVSATG